jgi:hypothetical protein
MPMNLEAVMPDTDIFWQYADEAMRCARKSDCPEEKRALTDLAFTWSQVALHCGDREGQLDGPSIETH